MHAHCCALQGLQGHIKSHCYTRQSKTVRPPQLQTWKPALRHIGSVVVVDFRDEVYASIASLLEDQGLSSFRAENTLELAGKLVSEKPDLVLLNGTQPDENVWLTSAKLRIIDASRPVWIYAHEPPSALDKWLSMADTQDVIVYGGMLHKLLDLLQGRLSLERIPSDRSVANDSQHRTVA